MSYDPNNNDESLHDSAPEQEAPAGAVIPPPVPPPAPDPLFDEPGYAAAAPAARSARSEGVDKKTLIGAGVGAAVIALGAVFGINLASSSADDATNTAATGPMGMTQGGQSGQFPGAQSGTDGSTQQVPGQSGDSGQAQGGMQGGPQGTTGTVEDVGDGTLTISTDDGQSVEVTTTDGTEVSISQSQSADDIDEGDTVMVIGQSSDGSSVTAERVVERSGDDNAAQGGPGGPGGGMGPITGEVSSVDGDTFTVSTDSGDVTVTMTSDTTVVVERQGSVSDLSQGDEVFVHTETADDGSTWAERIITGDDLPDFSAGPGGMSGGMQGSPSQGSSSGQSGTMAPPSQGGTSGTGTSSGSTGGAPGANAGPAGVTTT